MMFLSKLSFLVSLCTFTTLAHAQIEWVTDIRDNKGAAESFCQSQPSQCRVVDGQATEFSNGNTFVQVQSPLAYQRVRLLLPPNPTANGFMEALIKVRTFKTEGARDIIVEFPEVPTEAPNAVLPHEFWIPLLKVAGAHRVMFRGNLSVAFHQAPERNRVPYGPVSDTVVVDYGNPQLSQSFSEGIGSAVVAFDSVLSAEEPHQVFLLSSSAESANKHFLDSLVKADALIRKGHEVILVLPYFPYSRSDKVDQPGVTATAKLVADLIESVEVSGVVASRLHAPQVHGYFNIPFVHVSGRQTIDDYLVHKQIDAIISPDGGFQKEATLYADRMSVPVYVLNKQRDPITGKHRLVMMGDIDLTGKRLAVIDDETASGGTLDTAAEYLKTHGGASYVLGAVTHLAGSANKALKSPYLDQIVITNTFPTTLDSQAAVILDIGKEMGEKARRLSIASLRKLNPDCPPLLE